VASFNVHGGVDGWGRPFDVVEVCRALDADVLVLQETWTPLEGQGTAEQVAAALGYRMTSASMAPARQFPAPAGAGDGWGPVYRARGGVGMCIDFGRNRRSSDHRRRGRRGATGLALLDRLGAGEAEVLHLPRPGGERVRRLALRAMVKGDSSSPLVVTGTHLSHLRQGSLLQLRHLRRVLSDPGAPAVLMGDMNMWGPMVSLAMHGWSRAVSGPSWPSWRPVFQIDHILVTSAVQVLGAEVVPAGGSDHFPVRATLAVA